MPSIAGHRFEPARQDPLDHAAVPRKPKKVLAVAANSRM
jgi:hypothetical protein